MKNALQPRWIFLAYWVAIIAVTLLLLPTSTLDWSTISLILAYSVTFTVAVFIATTKAPSTSKGFESTLTRQDPKLNGRIIGFAVLAGSTFNLVAAVLALRSSNLSIGDILTLQGLADSANTMAVARYTLEGTGSGPGIAFLLGTGYAAALIAPFARLTAIKRKLLFSLLPVLTSLAYASVSSARLGFLIAASLTVGGFIASTIAATGKAPTVRPKVLLATLCAGALIAGAFIGIGALRIGEASANSVRLSFEKQVIYAVGSAGAFATWYGEYGNGLDQELGYGTATIAGVEYFTGQQRSDTRAFNEFSDIDSSGRKSNVYTMFRGLLLDFGIAGTFIALAIAGFMFGRLSRRASYGRPVAAAFVGYGYATIFLSAWMATTTFTNVLAVALVAPLVIRLAHRRTAVGEAPLAPPTREGHSARSMSHGAVREYPR